MKVIDSASSKNTDHAQMSKYTPKMVSVILRSSHTDVCSNANFSNKYGFHYLFDSIETGWDFMIDSWDGLVIGRVHVLAVAPFL